MQSEISGVRAKTLTPSFSPRTFHSAALQSTEAAKTFIENSNHDFSKLPLWLQLANEGSGLRYVSPNWMNSWQNSLKLIGKNPGFPKLNRNTPSSCFRSGDYLIAANCFKTLMLDPYYYALGLIHTGRIDEALKISLKIEYQKTMVQSQAELHTNRKLSDEMVLKLKEISNQPELSPLERVSIINLINFSLRKGNSMRIIENLKLVESIGQGIQDERLKNHVLGNCFYHKAKLLIDDQNSDEAETSIKKAIELDHGFYEYHLILGQIYFLKGKVQEGREEFVNSISLSCLNKELINDIGMILNESELESDFNDVYAIAGKLGFLDDEN